jgi:hypothetical protein
VGEARRRRGLAKQIPFPDTVAYATTPGYGLPLTPGKQLTEQQQTAALLMYLFAVLTWNPGPSEDEDDDRWYVHCTNHYARSRTDSFEACVWWAMRYEAGNPEPEEDWLGYLAHVCRNHRILTR